MTKQTKIYFLEGVPLDLFFNAGSTGRIFFRESKVFHAGLYISAAGTTDPCKPSGFRLLPHQLSDVAKYIVFKQVVLCLCNPS